jgi:GTP cyclohydrolase I
MNLNGSSERTAEVDLVRAEQAVREFMAALNLDVSPGIWNSTPMRMAKAYAEILSPPRFEATSFENSSGYHGMVTLEEISFQSICEHHLLPFVGVAALTYVPRDRVIGLSKLAWAVRHLAARPQIQERITQNVLDWIVTNTECDFARVRIKATHSCVTLRGVRAEGAEMVTEASVGIPPQATAIVRTTEVWPPTSGRPTRR